VLDDTVIDRRSMGDDGLTDRSAGIAASLIFKLQQPHLRFVEIGGGGEGRRPFTFGSAKAKLRGPPGHAGNSRHRHCTASLALPHHFPLKAHPLDLYTSFSGETLDIGKILIVHQHHANNTRQVRIFQAFVGDCVIVFKFGDRND